MLNIPLFRSRSARSALLLAATAPLSGCYSAVEDPIYTPCPITGSSDWRAALEEGPDGERVVRVSGKVTVPTGGYLLALEKGYVQKLEPPRQQVILRATPPQGMATQALVTEDVSGSFRIGKDVDGVTVRCGDKTLSSISPLPRG